MYMKKGYAKGTTESIFQKSSVDQQGVSLLELSMLHETQ